MEGLQELICAGQNLRVGVPNAGYYLLALPREESPTYKISSNCKSPYAGGYLHQQELISVFPTHLSVVLLFFVEQNFFV